MSVTRMARGAAAVVMLFATAACKGPEEPLDVTAKEVALDLLLGAKQTVADAPLPPVRFDVDATGIPTFTRITREIVDPPIGGARVQQPPAGKRANCELDPLAVPKRVAGNKLFAPPKAATHTYNSKGSFKVGGASPSETPVPPTATVTVLNPVFEPLALQSTWDVAVKIGGATTTTSYRVSLLGQEAPAAPYTYRDLYEMGEGTVEDPASSGGPVILRNLPKTGDVPGYPGQPAEDAASDAARPNKGLPPGLFITKVQTSGGGLPFQPPAPGLLLAKLPLGVNDSFDTAASDGTTTMSYRSTVLQKATVNACGTPLDSWTIELTRGRIASLGGGQVIEFTARYQLGTQYGGLILSDITDVTGTQAATPIVRHVELTISDEPKP